MAVRCGTARICVLRTSHLEPYRTSVPYFSSIFEAYRTNVPYPYHYKKAIPYQRTVLLGKNWGVPCRTTCGVKKLVMCSACKCCNHADHVSDNLSKWTNSERFNLFLCHVFAMHLYQRSSISASFEWFRFPNDCFSIFFYLWAGELKLVSFY